MHENSPEARRETVFAISLVILTTLLTYGMLLSQLGFYRDDWYLVWTAESLGEKGILSLFQGDRPFVGWLYVLDFAVVGVSPLGWHIYALLIKIASALGFLWLLRSLWPKLKLETTFITLLFIVYPGFYQQPNALTFKQLLLAYAAGIFSLAFTVNAVKADRTQRKVVLAALSLLSTGLYILIYESLVGLELVRLILVWYVLNRQNGKWRESLRSSLVNALPNLIFTVLFVVWRIFIFQSTRKATNVDAIMGHYSSLHGLIGLLVETGKDLLETSVLSWGVPFYQFGLQAIYKDFGLALGLGLMVLLASIGYYYLVRKQMAVSTAAVSSESTFDWLPLGLVMVFVTTLPVVVAGRNVLFAIQWDRYTYQSAIGAALLMGGFVFYALRGNFRWIILGMLLISGVCTQVFSAMYYRDFWSAQREAWWQMYWRAPQISEGTTLIASLPGAYQFAEEYEVWGPLNLIYHFGRPLALSGQVMFEQLVTDLERGTLEDRIVRGTITVPRDYNKVLVASVPSDRSCLHVYDGLLPDNSSLESLAMANYSNIDFIQADAALPEMPSQIMGEEPVHTWCYYYQKINLSLQTGKWEDASRLADEARFADLNPDDTTEWLPVIAAYANAGDEKKAKQVSTYINDKQTRLRLCQQLNRITEWPDGYRSDIILKYLCKSN